MTAAAQMSTFRIALANIQYPGTPEESIPLTHDALRHASTDQVDIVCFPECFVPGYRAPGKEVPPPDQVFLERAWSSIAAAAKKGHVGVVLGTERIEDNGLLISASSSIRTERARVFKTRTSARAARIPAAARGPAAA